MSDIIITMPDKENEGIKDLIKHYYQSKDNDGLIYYRVSKLPKNTNPGDKCYIISNSEIIGYHIIKEIRFVDDKEAKELSDGDWKKGNYIIRSADSFVELNPKIKASGFQGFRYYDKFIKKWVKNEKSE